MVAACVSQTCVTVHPKLRHEGGIFEIWFVAWVLKQLDERLLAHSSTWSVTDEGEYSWLIQSYACKYPVNFTLLRLESEGPVSDNRGEGLPGLQQTKEIILAKRCKFSSVNGVGSRLCMLHVIGREFSNRKLHVSQLLIVLSEVLE